MALAVMRVVMSIAVTGTRWIVAPATGWPGLAAAPPTTKAPDALTTWPVNWRADWWLDRLDGGSGDSKDQFRHQDHGEQ